MPDHHYENAKLAEIYDLDSPWSIDRDFYLLLAGPTVHKVLDLGCGTGLLCNAYAGKNCDVTGVDPSAAMLEIARRKPNGKNIEWVQSTAQKYLSLKRFDLIIMTGHAFQVLLGDADVLAAFHTMRHHLNSGGLIAFESRNPLIDWRSNWNYEMQIDLPGRVVIESRRFIAMQDGRMTFEIEYKFPDQTLISESELRFWSREEIEERMKASGLRLEKLLGDWQQNAFEEDSQEMIFLARASE